MFPVQDVEEKIKKIKQGDSLAREIFLENCRPFVFKETCRYFKRTLDWNRDDELAVALIAFNEAIDRYRGDSGVPFPAYARMVIRSRLTDHCRRERKNIITGVPLPGDGLNGAELARSWDAYLEEEAARERGEEIKEFEELLRIYGITFEDLVKCSPKHSDTRRALLLAARVLAKKNSLLEELRGKKKLPLNELVRETGVGRKTLERGRKYIIAMALLISRRKEFLYLSSYLNLSALGLEGGVGKWMPVE